MNFQKIDFVHTRPRPHAVGRTGATVRKVDSNLRHLWTSKYVDVRVTRLLSRGADRPLYWIHVSDRRLLDTLNPSIATPEGTLALIVALRIVNGLKKPGPDTEVTTVMIRFQKVCETFGWKGEDPFFYRCREPDYYKEAVL